MEIQVGKTYLTRTGECIQITRESPFPGTYRMQGRDGEGRITWRSRKGRFTTHPHPLDLVKEAPEK